ncbi:MAG: HD domain-containing protein, partial [Candidatus Diapherotrites archaeon]|nr:HD domain-containing protein [Candidatus Diapherotrites archaeon]
MSCWIKDSVHGDVFASDAAQELLETPEMQRLRRISQTSFSSTIYPGANHTRFEHSIGTYYLTNRYSFFHNIEKERGESTAAHALLHDIGHSCFSHALESVLENYLGKNHEEATEEIISNGRIKEILDKHGISPGYDASIIDSELGTDRMDYLMRDSKYTGVAYGAV